MTCKRGGLATAQGSRQQCDAPDSLTLVLGLSLHSLMLMLAEHAEDDTSSALRLCDCDVLRRAPTARSFG